MKRFIRPISIIGVSVFVGVVVRFVRIKTLAVYVGLNGLGVMGQAWNLLLLMTTLSLLGTRNGIVRYLAQTSESSGHNKPDAFLYTMLSFVLFVSILWLSLFILFSSQISYRIFGSTSFKFLVMLLSLAIPFTAITLLLDSFLQGARDAARYSIASVLRDCVSLIIFVPLTIGWGLRGTIAAVALVSTSSFFITLAFFKKSFPGRLRKLYLSGFDSNILKKVMKVGLVVFVCMGSINFALLTVRSLIIHHVGMAGHGVFQAAYGLVDTYPEFLAGSSTLYITAYFSGLKIQEMMSGLNEFFRLGILSFVPIGCIIILFGNFLIGLVYSAQFIESVRLLPLMVLATFLKIAVYLLGLAFIPLLKLRIFLVLHILCQLSFVLLSFVLLNFYSLQGVIVAYLISYGILFIMLFVFLKSSIGFEFLHKNRVLILNSVILMAAVCLLSVFHIKASAIMGIGLLALWLVFSTTAGEKEFLKNFIKRRNEG